jgi:hypothetical protein
MNLKTNTMAKELKLCKRDQTLIEGLNLTGNGNTYKTTNPYSGASELLDERGARLYEYVKNAERNSKWTDLNKGLSLFRKLYPSEYYTLLD